MWNFMRSTHSVLINSKNVEIDISKNMNEIKSGDTMNKNRVYTIYIVHEYGSVCVCVGVRVPCGIRP